MKTKLLPFFLFICALFEFGTTQIYAQSKELVKLKKAFDEKLYEDCYFMADEYLEKSPDNPDYYMFKVASFVYLPSKDPAKAENPEWQMKAMEYLDNCKKGELEKTYDKFYIKISKKVQKDAFKYAEKKYQAKETDIAVRYFDMMYKVFDNSTPLFANEFSNSLISKDFELFLESVSPGLSKNDFYIKNPDFKKWDNPVYRLAEKIDEQAGYAENTGNFIRFLNMMRMNPELFYKTYIKTYLLLCAVKDAPAKGGTPSDDASIISNETADSPVKSLIEEFKNFKKTDFIQNDFELQKSASCWAEESGKLGLTGHRRNACKAFYVKECCLYADKQNVFGTEILLTLLLDKNEASRENRAALLSGLPKIGIAEAVHSDYKKSVVIDLGN